MNEMIKSIRNIVFLGLVLEVLLVGQQPPSLARGGQTYNAEEVSAFRAQIKDIVSSSRQAVSQLIEKRDVDLADYHKTRAKALQLLALRPNDTEAIVLREATTVLMHRAEYDYHSSMASLYGGLVDKLSSKLKDLTVSWSTGGAEIRRAKLQTLLLDLDRESTKLQDSLSFATELEVQARDQVILRALRSRRDEVVEMLANLGPDSELATHLIVEMHQTIDRLQHEGDGHTAAATAHRAGVETASIRMEDAITKRDLSYLQQGVQEILRHVARPPDR